MATSNIRNDLLQQIRTDPKYSVFNARRWFERKVFEMTGKTKVGSLTMLGQYLDTQSRAISIGQMTSFIYDPKHKATLPYYDKFPLVLPFSFRTGGFLGINLHYLPPPMRLGMLSQLMEIADYNAEGEVQKLRLSWAYLNNIVKFPQVGQTVKHYLNGHVKSNFAVIPPDEWAMAIMLPTENWAKGSPW